MPAVVQMWPGLNARQSNSDCTTSVNESSLNQVHFICYAFYNNNGYNGNDYYYISNLNNNYYYICNYNNNSNYFNVVPYVGLLLTISMVYIWVDIYFLPANLPLCRTVVMRRLHLYL